MVTHEYTSNGETLIVRRSIRTKPSSGELHRWSTPWCSGKSADRQVPHKRGDRAQPVTSY
jgi:hypothetical protein